MEGVNIPAPDYYSSTDGEGYRTNASNNMIQRPSPSHSSFSQDNQDLELVELEEDKNLKNFGVGYHKNDASPCRSTYAENNDNVKLLNDDKGFKLSPENLNLQNIDSAFIGLGVSFPQWWKDSWYSRFNNDLSLVNATVSSKNNLAETLSRDWRQLLNAKNRIFPPNISETTFSNTQPAGTSEPNNFHKEINMSPTFSTGDRNFSYVTGAAGSPQRRRNTATGARSFLERRSVSFRDFHDQESSIKNTMSKFAERASLPGIIFLYTSLTTCARAVWCLLLLLCLGMLTLHLFYLINVYSSWPKHTQVSLGFDTLQFPAVTFCNVNPARYSKLNLGSSEIQELAKKTQPENLVSEMIVASQLAGEIKRGLRNKVEGTAYEDFVNDGIDYLEDIFRENKKKNQDNNNNNDDDKNNNVDAVLEVATASHNDMASNSEGRPQGTEQTPGNLGHDKQTTQAITSATTRTKRRDPFSQLFDLLNRGKRSWVPEVDLPVNSADTSFESLMSQTGKVTSTSAPDEIQPLGASDPGLSADGGTKTTITSGVTPIRDFTISGNNPDNTLGNPDSSSMAAGMPDETSVSGHTAVNNDGGRVTEDSTMPSSTNEPSNDFDNDPGMDETSNTNTMNNPTTDATNSAPESTADGETSEGSETNKKAMNFINQLDLQISNIKSEVQNEIHGLYESTFPERSAASSIAEQYIYLLMKEKRITRVEMGHQIEDMLVDCSFNGGRCYPDNFSMITSSTFGNCFSMDYDMMLASRSGPKYGLTLVIFLEHDEFLKGLTSGSGGHVVIHRKKTFPFPEEDGLSVAAGMEVSIGIRLMRISRLGKPYGECDQGKEFYSRFGIIYTRRTCQHFCEQSLIVDACGCYDNEQEEVQRIYNGTVLYSGRMCSTVADYRCMMETQRKYLNKELACECSNPCDEHVYTKSMSLRQWPSDEFANVLVEALCESRSKEECEKYRLADKRTFVQNFIKLNIFFEDLNYENVTELASYETTQFFSDVGGALGLWLGLSVMAIMELGHLATSLVRHLALSLWKRLSLTKQTN